MLFALIAIFVYVMLRFEWKFSAGAIVALLHDVTITLGVGVRRMMGRRALLRRLQAAETLGSATVVCTDKTGTLTQNEMTVVRVWTAAGAVEVEGAGYAPVGRLVGSEGALEPGHRPDVDDLVRTGLHCNHAQLEAREDVFDVLVADGIEVSADAAVRLRRLGRARRVVFLAPEGTRLPLEGVDAVLARTFDLSELATTIETLLALESDVG